MAMARRDSVTVSIAADTNGRFSVMLRDRRVARLVSRGNTFEYAGTNNTSSKVSALPRRRMDETPDAKNDYTDRPHGHTDAVTLCTPVARGLDTTLPRCSCTSCRPGA